MVNLYQWFIKQFPWSIKYALASWYPKCVHIYLAVLLTNTNICRWGFVCIFFYMSGLLQFIFIYSDLSDCHASPKKSFLWLTSDTGIMRLRTYYLFILIRTMFDIFNEIIIWYKGPQSSTQRAPCVLIHFKKKKKKQTVVWWHSMVAVT